MKYISKKDHEKAIKRSFPQKGSILYSHIGANRGHAAEVDIDFEFSIKNVALFKSDEEKVLSKYLVALLNINRFRDYMLQASSGGAQNFLDLDFLRSLKIPVPPIELQRKFSLVLTNTMKIWKYQAISTFHIEELFNSLMSKAFKGELNVTTVD